MPELPEVETVVRTLRPHVQGLTLLCAREIRPCALKGSLPFERAEGAKVCLVRRRGKLAVLELEREEGRLFLCVHLRMTGSLLAREGLAIADSRALEALAGPRTRAVFGFAEGASWPCTAAVCFDDVRTFGRILAGGERELAAWPFWRTLGPEPLDMDAGAFRAVLRGRRCIKALLLDQKVIAGVGNIYADESLFAAGIHPETPADGLSPDPEPQAAGAMPADSGEGRCGVRELLQRLPGCQRQSGLLPEQLCRVRQGGRALPGVRADPCPDQGGRARQRGLSALPAQAADKALGMRLFLGYLERKAPQGSPRRAASAGGPRSKHAAGKNDADTDDAPARRHS